jgi:predicted protein tyrosine phosphatase
MPPAPPLPPLSLLTICGLAELGAHGRRAVTHVLSILDPGEPEPAGFTGYEAHHRTTLLFHDVIADGGGMVLPSRDHVAAVLAFGRELAAPAQGDLHLLVHCHMGISRSTAAMATLLLQADPAADEDVVFDRIAAARPQAWPNSRMIGFADELLGRAGRFRAALGRLYARQLLRSPEIATFMNANGRGAEVALAQVGARELGLTLP